MPSVSIGFILKYNKPLVFSITNIRESIKNFYHINVSVPMAVMCMGRVRAAPRAGEYTWQGKIETNMAFRVSFK